MNKEKMNYIIGENVYKTIENLTNYSKEIIGSSTNLISELSSLFESIEDDITSEILSDAGKINDFISSISLFMKNELQEIKIKSKIAIEKAEKRKGKINKLKEENKNLKEKIKEAENEKKNLILNIDSISSQLSEIYMENQMREKTINMEQIDKRNEKIIKEKYIKEINDMQKDIDNLKEKNKIFENNATKFKRKSIILEEKNKKLKDELGAQTRQYLNKTKEHIELKKTIDSLRLQNDNLSKKVKYSHNQFEKLQEKYQNLEEKIDKEDYTKKIFENNFKKIDINNRKNGKKINQIRDKEISDSDNENDPRYKTFSNFVNLGDLLGNESDTSNQIESNKISENIYTKKKKKDNFKKYSFDLDYIFEIKCNTYENFFG